MIIKNLIGKKFGKLIVIERLEFSDTRRAHLKDKNHAIYLCKCKCGKEILVNNKNLTRGSTTSCGCWFHTKLAAFDSNFKLVYNAYIKNAENRGLSFLLSKDEFTNLTQQNCFYCGSPPLKSIT